MGASTLLFYMGKVFFLDWSSNPLARLEPSNVHVVYVCELIIEQFAQC
jgi:hypothetical protein